MTEDPFKVLMVEDNPGDADLIREMFLDAPDSIKFELIHVDRLNKALTFLNDQIFDVILLDLNLPDSKGLKTFTKIYEIVPDLPIIMMTGIDDESLGITSVSEGAQDYLVKGKVNSDQLTRSIRYAIERKKTAEKQYQMSLQRIDGYMDEFVKSKDPNKFNKVLELVGKLFELANQQKSHWLLAETYALRSKLALIDLDIINAQRFLTEAQSIAEEKGLQKLAMKISSEHDILLDQISDWESLDEKAISFAKRTELARLEEQMSRMIRKNKLGVPVLPEDVPIMLLLVVKGGITLFSKQFLPESHLDGTRIGGFLTAINGFIREAFSVPGSIERIKHKDYTLIFKQKDQSLFCYVFKGQSYSANQKLNRFINDVQELTSIRKAMTSKRPKVHELSEADCFAIEKVIKKIFLHPRQLYVQG